MTRNRNLSEALENALEGITRAELSLAEARQWIEADKAPKAAQATTLDRARAWFAAPKGGGE